MIYTSYYAQSRNFPKNSIQVSISLGTPNFFTGYKLIELAPPYYVLSKYKKIQSTNPSSKELAELEDWYVNEYTKHLDKLGIDKIKRLISNISNDDNIFESKNNHIILLCYEKAGSFCHRNILASYLRSHDVQCYELQKYKEKNYREGKLLKHANNNQSKSN